MWADYLPGNLASIKKMLWCWLRDWQVGVEGFMRLSSLLFSCYANVERFFSNADALCPIYHDGEGYRFWWDPNERGWAHYQK
eukprot:6130190-Amphidinium_carterae.1